MDVLLGYFSYSLLVFEAGFIIVGSQTMPMNAFAKEGGRAILNCTNNNTVPSWGFSRNGIEPYTFISSGCVINPGQRTYYSTEQQAGFSCNIIIANITTELAGVYQCGPGFGTAFKGQLTVIDNSASGATIDVKNRSDVAEGDTLTLSCAVFFRTSTSPAPVPRVSVEWTNGQNLKTIDYNETTNAVYSHVKLNVQRPIVPSFQCTAHFTVQFDSSLAQFAGYATNNLTYNWTATDEINVFYKPNAPNITTETVIVTLNDGVSCRLTKLTGTSSSANPPANYRWTDVDDPQPWYSMNDSHSFPFAEDGRTYRCTAFNFFRGQEQSTASTYTVSNMSSQPQPCKFPHRGLMNIYPIDSKCDNVTNTCSCENAIHVTLGCLATNVFPEPTYRWEDETGKVLTSRSYFSFNYSGTYRCIASTNIPGLTVNSSISVNVPGCHCPIWMPIISFIIPWVVVSIIVTVVFTVCYFVLAKPFRAKMDSRFVWLQLMLPYGNNASEVSQVFPWKKYVFVLLFFVIAPTCGMVFFPVLVTLAYGCPKGLACLIISMWVGVIVLTFPLAFLLVYIIHCKQMITIVVN